MLLEYPERSVMVASLSAGDFSMKEILLMLRGFLILKNLMYGVLTLVLDIIASLSLQPGALLSFLCFFALDLLLGSEVKYEVSSFSGH